MSVHEDPAREAWELLWRVMQANKPRLTALAQEMGLAPMQLHALRLIEPGDGVPMSSLAEKLFCDASNVTGIVDRLEDRGLVERTTDTTDRRATNAHLTEAGWDLVVATAPDHVRHVRSRVIDALTPAQVDQLRDITEAILARIDPEGAMTGFYSEAAP